jgi:hypothetical protein
MARHARVHAVERRVSTAEDLRRGRHRRRVGGKPEEEGRVGKVRPAVEAQCFGELEHDHLAEPFRRLQPDGAEAAGGFAGRPGGPVPTIKISLQNMPFRFFFLGDLLGFRDMQIPSATTTMTGEDLYSCSPIMRRGCSGFP